MPNTVFSCANLYCVQAQSMLRWPTAHTQSTNSICASSEFVLESIWLWTFWFCEIKMSSCRFNVSEVFWVLFVCSCWWAQILTKQRQSSIRLKSTRVSWKYVVLGEIITSSKPVAHIFGCCKVWLFCCCNVWWLWNILHHLFSRSSEHCGLRNVSPSPMVL